MCRAVIKDIKPSGVDGGTFFSNGWRKRDFNTMLENDIGAELHNNEVTLKKGSYFFSIKCDSFNIGLHKIRIFNGTSSVYLSGLFKSDDCAVISCSLSFKKNTTLSIEHCHDGRLLGHKDGFGRSGNHCNQNIYSQMIITKLKD